MAGHSHTYQSTQEKPKRFPPHRMAQKSQAKRMGGRMRGKRGVRH